MQFFLQRSGTLLLLVPVFIAGFLALGFAAGFGNPDVWQALVGRAPQDAPALRGLAGIVGLITVVLCALLSLRLPLCGWTGIERDGDAQVHWAWVLVLCLLMGYLTVVEIKELDRLITRVTDFGTFYRASVAVMQHGDPYALTMGEYLYPPTFAYLIRPLNWVPITWASVIWFIAKLMMLVAMTRWSFDLLDGFELEPRRRVLLLIGMLTATARFWIADLQYGNTNILIAFLLLGAVALDLRRRSPMAGVLAAVAMTIKVVPGLLFLWLLARRSYRAIGWGAAAMLVLNLVPFALEPAAAAEVWNCYVEHGVVGKLAGDLSKTDNQSLWGVLSRVLPDQPVMVRIVWIVVSLTAMGGLFRLTKRLYGRPAFDQAVGGALALALVLVVSPGSWVVHFVMAFFPMAALLRLGLTDRRYRRLYLLVFLLAYMPLTMSGWWRTTVRISLEGAWFLATIVIVIACLTLAVVANGRGSAWHSPSRSTVRLRDDDGR